MRIMIDLDGTICELKKEGQDYSEVKANPGAINKIQRLKEEGHYIIISTARHMKTCGGDHGKVMARIGKKTLDWLNENKVPYDEIYFGKPNAHVYIDDLAQKFTDWESMDPKDLNNDHINILIPMAGAGSRFVEAGYTEPKPLIDVLGEPMIKWALKSFNFLDKLKSYDLIFVILKEHDQKYELKNKLFKIFDKNIKIIELAEITRGQAETCLAADKYINNHNKLFIFNCDTFSTAPIWDLILTENPDGILPCFKATDPKYSFAGLDEYGYVSRTAEKDPISEHATNGMYYFKRGSDFVSAAEKQIKNNHMSNNEFYVAPLYNELIKSGKKIRVVKVENNNVMGTPEELNQFISKHNE